MYFITIGRFIFLPIKYQNDLNLRQEFVYYLFLEVNPAVVKSWHSRSFQLIDDFDDFDLRFTTLSTQNTYFILFFDDLIN